MNLKPTHKAINSYHATLAVLWVDLRSSAEIAELLNTFFTHTEPDIEEFERAVDEFKERVPDLALGVARTRSLNGNCIRSLATVVKRQ
jgi:hypothetical protein